MKNIPIKIMLAICIDKINRLQLSDVDFCFYNQKEKQATDKDWLLRTYSNVNFITSEWQSPIGFNYLINQKHNYEILCYFTNIYDLIYNERIKTIDLINNIYIIFIRLNMRDTLQIRNVLCSYSYLTQSYIVALNNKGVSYVFNPFGECKFGKVICDYKIIEINIGKVFEAKKKWITKIEKIKVI